MTPRFVADIVNFIRVQLVIGTILRFSPIKFYKILLETAVLPRNLLDPCFELQNIKLTRKYKTTQLIFGDTK